MTNAKAVIVIVLICSAALGFYCWRHCIAKQIPIAQALVVGDPSSSVSNQEGVLVLGRRVFGLRGMGKGSTLTVLATGDKSTADEPVLVVKYEMPVSRRALEGKQAETNRKEAILVDLTAQWNRLNRTDRSPIFLAVKRGVEQLRRSGCTPETACYLLIKSDGQELSEPTIKKALRDLQSKSSLPAPIPNGGIRVVFCGLSETTGNTTEGGNRGLHPWVSDRNGMDRVRDVWRALFTQPELVTFEPYCRDAETISTKKD
jgi:hypothetical protein